MARYRSARRDMVWGGLAVLGLGLVVAAYAVTGDRIYDIVYAPVFLLGSAVALAGAAVAAWGRTGPRTQAEPLLPLREDQRAEAAPDPDALEADPEQALEDTSGPREVVVLDCPDCGTRFRDEGVRPFRADCPDCGFPGRVPEAAPS